MKPGSTEHRCVAEEKRAYVTQRGPVRESLSTAESIIQAQVIELFSIPNRAVMTLTQMHKRLVKSVREEAQNNDAEWVF